MNEEESQKWSRFIEEDPFFKTIEYVFNESTNALLRELDIFKIDNNWFLASDYSIRDRTKKNSVVTFTAIPKLDDFHSLDSIINYLIPADFKKIKSINPDFIKFIKETPIIFFSFILEMIDPDIPVDEFKENQAIVIARLKSQYEEAYAENAFPKYKDLLKRINWLNQHVKQKEYNWKLVADVLAIPYIGAYVATKIAEWDNVEKIIWFSDRDKILGLADNFAMMYFHECFWFLQERRNMKNDEVKIYITDAERYGRLKMYEGILRLPDYLCGILSDLDLETGIPEKPKSREGMINLISDNEKILIFRITHRNRQLKIERVLSTLK